MILKIKQSSLDHLSQQSILNDQKSKNNIMDCTLISNGPLN